MDPDLDPFHPLISLVERYRTEVHQLNAQASEASILSAEQRLGQGLPPTLGAFLRRWDGATLFRGDLVVRGVHELAPASEAGSPMVLFADGPAGAKWVFAPDGHGGWVFGQLRDGRLDPLHERFHRWLLATIRILDQEARDPEAVLETRRRCDPECGILLLRAGQGLLERGDRAGAAEMLRRATAADPQSALAWQRLGETLLAEDRSQARFALLHALRATRLPLPYPGAQAMSAEGLALLGPLFQQGDPAWEQELADFLGERCGEVVSPEGWQLHAAAVGELARLLLARGQRSAARDVRTAGLDRARAFAYDGDLSDLVLALAELETGLGEHDQAEEHLRCLRAHPDARVRALRELALARIAVLRQEPWAEEMLAAAMEALDDPSSRARCELLEAERLLLRDELQAAEAMFGRADASAIEAGDPGLQAATCLGLGDLRRARGDLEGAHEAWRKGRERAIEAGDPELMHRLLVRRGDLHLAAGRVAEASRDYARAARDYAELELPIRQAWALLRLYRAGADKDALDLARRIFMGCDLAAGVAACDLAEGAPERSLAWHLARSSEHARARHEARRCRPPLVRADADRPERRIGAHRVAVAAGGDRVALELGRELERCGSALDTARGSSVDPDVATYVASTDLLAFHRSYEAARILLDELVGRRLPDLPSRALRAALARSPNAALVAGLLKLIESPPLPRGAAAAVEVLGLRREREATGPLLRLLEAADSELPVRREAVVALGRIGDPQVIESLAPMLDDPALAADAAVALLLLGDRRGVDFHAQALATGRAADGRSGEIVGRYGGPDYLILLRSTALEEAPRALGALQGLGYLGDPRVVPVLLQALGGRDRRRRTIASAALELLSGHREDPAEPGLHAAWQGWWERAEPDFTAGVRYRGGRPVDLDMLLQKLRSDDLLVRRGAYDELVISTGTHLPFDADGPWRIQQAHLRAWHRWADQHRRRFPPGRWWFAVS